MTSDLSPEPQLVLEIYVQDIKRSIEFFRDFGFELVRDDGNFAVLQWEQSVLFLEEVPDTPEPITLVANIRIIVSDVDHYWDLALRLGAQVLRPVADRYYGLRDFTIAGPNGIGLRFATRIAHSVS
jgi:catechol 2,3-dioxygenase-like lactoylglutathione lyase family enzyme